MDSGFIYCVLLGLMNRLVLTVGVVYNLSLFFNLYAGIFLSLFPSGLNHLYPFREYLQRLPFLQYGTHTQR